MSSILKALKKLEAEKARAQGGQVDLTRDILQSSEPRRTSPLKLPLLMLLLILFGGLVGIVLVSWFDRPPVFSPVPDAPSFERVPAPQLPPEPAAQPQTGPVSRPVEPPADKPVPAKPAVEHAVVVPPTPQLVSHPSMVVSGIVFQTDPASRIAIVNDLPAMAGTAVEGVMIEEIREGSVVFSYQGERFEISLGE